MRILLISQYFPPEFGAAAARNSEHAQFWAEAGHEVEVLTGFPNYPEGVIPAEYRGRALAREERNGYRVTRAWIYATPNRGVFRRALASLSFFFSACIAGLFCCARPNVVIASSGPFGVGPLGWLIAFIRRVPFVLEVRDLLPQQAVDTGMIRNPALIALLTAIETFLYRRAARVVCVAEASRKTLSKRGVPEAKLCTIENGIREDLFCPGAKTNSIRVEHGWGDRFVALYAGAHGVSQGLGTILDAADSLRDEPGILFVFAGEGAEKPALMAQAAGRGLRNVQFLPIQPKEGMPELYAAADVCLVPLRRGVYFTLNIPSKMFEVMACARPILLGARGQALEIAESAGACVPVPPEDAAAFAQAIRDLRSHPERAAQLGESGRRFVLEHFTRRRKAERYLNVLMELFS